MRRDGVTTLASVPIRERGVFAAKNGHVQNVWEGRCEAQS